MGMRCAIDGAKKVVFAIASWNSWFTKFMLTAFFFFLPD